MRREKVRRLPVIGKGQQTDVAAKHPEVLKKRLAHYDQWWAGIEPRVNDFVTIIRVIRVLYPP